MTSYLSDQFRNDEYRFDGALANVLTGMGVPGKDKKLGNVITANALLTYSELQELYKNGLIRRYVDAIPETILRHCPTIIIGGNETTPEERDLVTQFETFLRRTNFAQALREVIQLQRIYGGAGLVLMIDDGLPPEEPVDPKRIRGIRGYAALSRHELIPQDVTFTDYSKPEHYLITTSQKLTPGQTESYVNVLIHHTRVARFDGLYLPWRLRVGNTGWGLSVIETIWDAFQNYEGALNGLNSLLSEGDLLVHQIPGLMQRIAAGGESDIRKRLELNNMARSVYGAMVLDKEEELTNLSRSLGNLADATEPFVRYLQAVTGWPASILMGDSPGGLGKEGRFEERIWASLVEQWQEVYCRQPITEVFQYIFLAKDGPTRGRDPENWQVHFPSVFTQTDEEKAALRSQVAQSDNVYVQMGALNAIEIRQSRFGGATFSIETQLDDTITEQLQTQAEMQFQQQVAGFDAQMQAMQMGAASPEAGGIPPENAQSASPAPTNKTDSFDTLEAHGLTIRVTHTVDDIRAGHLVAPDGQRIDAPESAPLMVFGPHRSKAYKLYRARFVADAELIDGPYIAGFASLKAAKQAVRSLYPRQTVAGLSPVPTAELESLRAGWETY